MSVTFATLRCWLDEDGEHIWQSHRCMPIGAIGTIFDDFPLSISMLPNVWRAVAGGHVEPSISCDICGLHTFGKIDPTPNATEAEEGKG